MPAKYFLCKMVFPPNPQMKICWRPAFVFFESDWSIKGIAIFTSFENADYYRMTMENQFSYIIETHPLNDASELMATIAEHFPKGCFTNTPVYLDPTTLNCKGASPSYKSLEQFLMKNMPNQIPWAHDLVAISMYNGFTIMTLKDKTSLQYSCVGAKGYHETREAVYESVETMKDTTEEKYTGKTQPQRKREYAEAEIKKWIDQIIKDEQ